MKSKRNLHTFSICAYQESPYLEDCILSLLEQTVSSDIVIATSTPNAYITALAQKYQLPVKVNPVCAGIGSDFDFAVCAADTPLVTVAHQDDMYSPRFTEQLLRHANREMLIAFTDYRENDANGKIYPMNRNLKIKKLLLFPMRFRSLQRSRFWKKAILRMGNPICCPSVSFYKKKITMPLFHACDLQCNIDWYAWLQLAEQKGSFVYVPQELMLHRVHRDATTTKLIKDSRRTREDWMLLSKLWPKPIARLIHHFYKKAEESVSEI